MTRLCDAELKAVNGPLRRFLQRRVEFPIFRWLGLKGQGLDILEVGCGSGYGAVLLCRLKPKSYLGIDLMPEMIDLALKRKRRFRRRLSAHGRQQYASDPRCQQGRGRDLRHPPSHPPMAGSLVRMRSGSFGRAGCSSWKNPAPPWCGLLDFFFNWGHPKDAAVHLAGVGGPFERRRVHRPTSVPAVAVPILQCGKTPQP